MGASPAQRRSRTEDTDSSGFVRRQAITRGTSLLGPYVKNAGLAGAVYFSQPTPRPLTSHLLPYDSTGKPQQYQYTHRGQQYTRAAESRKGPLGIPKQETWKGQHERSHTANRQGGRSSKTTPRSLSLAGASGSLYAFGKLLPTIGFFVAVDDLLSSGEESATYRTAKTTHDRSTGLMVDSTKQAWNFGTDAVFNPTSSPAAFVTHAALLALFS